MSSDLQDAPIHHRKCSYDNDLVESTLGQLLDCSSTKHYLHFCNFDSLKSGYFLSGWNSCENHQEQSDETDCSIGVHDKHYKKNSGNLPFGHENRTKKNEFAFKHYERGDQYIVQYRCNHTVGGTGRSWHDSQIAQTLMDYVINRQLKFPFISNHDIQLVNSIHQIADPSLTTGTLNIASIEQHAAQPPRNPPRPTLETETSSSLQNVIQLEDCSPSSRPRSATKISLSPLRKTPEGMGPIVLPKIHIKEYFSVKNPKKQFDKTRKHHNWSFRDPDVVHFVADYRATNSSKCRDNLPYRDCVADNKVCPKQTATSFVIKNSKCLQKISNAEDLVQDLLTNRKDVAAQESIQSLVKFFVSNTNIESDNSQNSLDSFDTWTDSGSLTSIGHEAFDNQELMVNGISSERGKARTRGYKDTFYTGGGQYDIKIPVQHPLPLSKDTVLFGDSYGKQEEHHASVD